jgi:hypothetical protein
MLLLSVLSSANHNIQLCSFLDKSSNTKVVWTGFPVKKDKT